MRLEFWGVRGTAPVSCQEAKKFGGHTICSYLAHDGEEHIVIDSGTGIIPLGKRLMDTAPESDLTIHLLLTHFHLDHIMGLPFFAPLYSDRAEIIFYSPVSPEESESLLAGLMSGRYFPVDFFSTPSKKSFLQAEQEGWLLGNIRIDCFPLRHPQGSVAYRFRSKGETWVLSTDTEHPESGVDVGLARFCSGAEALVYDAMYTVEDYRERMGWGHSTWLAGTELAKAAGVRRLFLSHFNPDYGDDVLERMVTAARREFAETEAATEIRLDEIG